MLMSKTSMQSRKMCFVEVDEETRPFFEEAFAQHDVSFCSAPRGRPGGNRSPVSIYRRKNRRGFSRRASGVPPDRHALDRVRSHRPRSVRQPEGHRRQRRQLRREHRGRTCIRLDPCAFEVPERFGAGRATGVSPASVCEDLTCEARRSGSSELAGLDSTSSGLGLVLACE